VVWRCATEQRKQCAITTFQLRAGPPTLFMETLPMFRGHSWSTPWHSSTSLFATVPKTGRNKGRADAEEHAARGRVARETIHDWVSA